MYSNLALKIYALKKLGIIKSNSDFWKNFNSREKIEEIKIQTHEFENEIKSKQINLVCIFDDDFPALSTSLPLSERPYFFAYRGDLNLIKTDEQNIAVIGSRTITPEIETREKAIVQALCEQNYNIVSGLAKGCDTTAHQTCLDQKCKTVATLPCEITNIYPPENTHLATQITQNGGLLISEYIDKPKSPYEYKARFVERDRLQALFSKAVILIASNKCKNTDSGSKHAMQKAKKYSKQTFVMFDPRTDFHQTQFRMNIDFLKKGARMLNKQNMQDFNSKLICPMQIKMPF